MSFSWNTIGMKHHPVRGQPEQFQEVEATFRAIAERTLPLSDDLSSMKLGRSDSFAGEAAKEIGSKIGGILDPLSDVPKVSSEIERVFDRHGRELEVLKTKAREALARAQTRWNRRETAEADVGRFESSVTSIKHQISQLRCYCAENCYCNIEGRQQQLEGSLRTAESNLRSAHSEFKTAENLVEDSRDEWRSRSRDEEVLNDSTAEELKSLPLWSLKDTGNFISEAAENAWEWITEAWEYFLDELLEVLYDVLSTLLDWLDIAGIILEWIPLVNVVYKAVELSLTALKMVAGLALVLTGQMTRMEFMLETVIDVLGIFVPGGRLIGKAAKGIAKGAGRVAKKLPGNIADSMPRKGLLNRDVYELPGIKGLNDQLRKGHDKLYRWKKWPSYHPKPARRQDFLGIKLQNLDKHSPHARFFRYNAPDAMKVKKDLLAPAGKTYFEWGSRRVEEFVSDNVDFVVKNVLGAEVKGLTDNDGKNTPNSYTVLVPSGF